MKSHKNMEEMLIPKKVLPYKILVLPVGTQTSYLEYEGPIVIEKVVDLTKESIIASDPTVLQRSSK